MIVGIWQPYFVPYLGYWQLINAVDKFVVYDDVNFIKGGRINRNSILVNGQAQFFNLPLQGASAFKHINEIGVNNDPRQQEKLLRTLQMCYSKAPYYPQVYPILEEVITQQESNLARYLYFSLQKIGEYLGIRTEMILSSELNKDCSLKAQDKVIAICKELGADTYYNSISGVPLYEPHRTLFEENGISLHFPKMRDIHYEQYKGEFVPNLSVIDVMMFNSQEECQRLLLEYDLI